MAQPYDKAVSGQKTLLTEEDLQGMSKDDMDM
jgi:hypothetical protein